MDRLILLRHGEAERDSATGEDYDRPLAKRGRKESASAGEALADLGLIPDLALVSGALRARETWMAAAPAFPKARVKFEDRLYLAEPEVVRRLAEAAGEGVGAVMVVGHNPGLHELVMALLIEGGGPPSAISRAQGGFPTGAAAVFLIGPSGRPAHDGLFYPRDRR
jgi:phosphohistidine phosphatase